MILEYTIYFIAAFVATFGFGIIYNAPKESLIASGITGGVGWIISDIINSIFGAPIFIGTTVAAFSIALMSQLWARRLYMPVTIFAIPAIIPLVPGGTAYNAMRAFVEGRIPMGMDYLVEVILTAGALALGLTVNSAVFQVFSPKAIWQRGRRYLP